MAYALDTNLIVRWLVRDNELQTKKIDALLESGQKLYISDMTFSELVFVLGKFYELSDDKISQCVQKIIEHNNISCNKAFFEQVLRGYARPPRVSFVDVCLVHYAKQDNRKLLTFDKTLAKKMPALVELV